MLQLGRLFAVRFPRVGDLGLAESQEFQASQLFEVHQPSVRHLGAIQVQVVQTAEPLQVCQPRVGDLCVTKPKAFKRGVTF